MATLYRPGDGDSNFIEIKLAPDGWWHIYMGEWKVKEDASHFIDFKTTEEITMGRDDICRLAEEMKRLLHLKPVKEIELKLSFHENKPQFKAHMLFMTPSAPYYSNNTKGKFQLSVGFNVWYSFVKHRNEGDDYMYIDGGRHQVMPEYYDEATLNKFADELLLEAE